MRPSRSRTTTATSTRSVVARNRGVCALTTGNDAVSAASTQANAATQRFICTSYARSPRGVPGFLDAESRDTCRKYVQPSRTTLSVPSQGHRAAPRVSRAENARISRGDRRDRQDPKWSWRTHESLRSLRSRRETASTELQDRPLVFNGHLVGGTADKVVATSVAVFFGAVAVFALLTYRRRR
jgi:hypothetical protein